MSHGVVTLEQCSIVLRPQSHIPAHHAAVTSIIIRPESATNETDDSESIVRGIVGRRSSNRPRSIPNANSAPDAISSDKTSKNSGHGFSLVTTSRDATIRCWRSSESDSNTDESKTSGLPASIPPHERICQLQPVSLPLPAPQKNIALTSTSVSSSSYQYLEGHTEWITSGVLLSDQQTLITASLDTTIKLWNTKLPSPSSSTSVPSPCLGTLSRHGDYIQSLSYCPYNQMLISAGLNFELYSWRVDAPGAPKLIDNLTGSGNNDEPTSPNSANSTSPTHQDFGVHEFDRLRGSFYATALSENGNTLLTGSSDEIVRLWDTRCLVASSATSAASSKNWLKLLGHTDNIRSVTIQERMGSGQSMAYSSSCDGSIRIWDLRMQACLRTCTPGGPISASKPIPSDRICDLRERLRLQGLGLRPQPLALQTNHILTRATTATPSSFTSASDATRPIPLPLSSHAIWTMVLDSTYTKAFTGGAGPTVWMTDLTTGHSEPIIRFRVNPAQAIASSVVNLTLDESRQTLWVALWDGSVSGWNIAHCLVGTLAKSSQTQLSQTQPPISSRRRHQHLSSASSSSLSQTVPASSSKRDSDDEEEEEDQGIFPLLISAPTHTLPLSTLPPIERFVSLHDRVHVLASHYNNSAAFDLVHKPIHSSLSSFSDQTIPHTQLISTWNIVEGTCLDVARLPVDPSMPSTSPALNLDTIAELLNTEFGRRAVSFTSGLSKDKQTPKDDKATALAPIPSHKLIPTWCQLDARLGCLSLNLDRRSCFSADVTGWFKDSIVSLQAAQKAGPTGPDSAQLGRIIHSHILTPFQSSVRMNLGEILLYTLLTEWFWLEDVMLREQTASGAGAHPHDARLIRPVPPSSRWLSNILFPNSVTHGLAGSATILAAWAAARTTQQTAITETQHHVHHLPPRSASAMSSRPTTIPTITPNLTAALSVALTLIVNPHKSSPYLPSVCTLPLTTGPLDSHATQITRARHLYPKFVPTWIEGIVFAPGATPVSPVEKEVRQAIEMESAQASEMWRNKAATTQAQLLSPVGALLTTTTTPARTPSSAIAPLHPPRVTATAAAGRSEDLSSLLIVEPDSGVESLSPLSSSSGTVISISSPSPPTTTVTTTASRRSSGHLHLMTASPRYAPQAMSPNVPSLVTAASNAAAATVHNQLTKIQFQLLPLPPRVRAGHDVQRRLFGGPSDDGEVEEEDETELRRDALRMGTSHNLTSNVTPPLPVVGSGSLVVPANLTVRRIAAYICQRLWKDPLNATYLPHEMREEFAKQKEKVLKEKAAQEANRSASSGRDLISGGVEKLNVSVHSPASAAVASGAELKPLLVTPTPTKANHLPLTGQNVLTPSGVHPSIDSPSVRRTASFTSMYTPSITSRSPNSPAHRAMNSNLPLLANVSQLSGWINPTRGFLVQREPENFLQLLLWNPVTNSPYILSPDLEIGSVREVIWPKLRRAANAASYSANSNDPRRSSLTTPIQSRHGSSNSNAPTSDLLAALDTRTNDHATPASSRQMLIYYTRTSLGEEWSLQEQQKPSSLTHPQVNTTVPSAAAPTTDTSTSSVPSVPRIIPGLQTADNLPLATPIVLSTSGTPPVTLPISLPRPRINTAATTTAAVKTVRSPTSLPSPITSPTNLTKPIQTSLPTRSAHSDSMTGATNPTNKNSTDSGVILSRHQRMK